MRPVPAGTDPHAALSVFGLTGLTAYFGLIDVGRVKEGDVVVVSGAAGATGSVVGQIARIKGASKVVGIAGGPEKCSWLTDELGFDDAIDYRAGKVGAALSAACPDGIDLFFDNVGGEILDHCLARLALHGRIVLCGAIATYNDSDAQGARELPDADRSAGADGGLSDPRLLQPVRRGAGRDGGLGRPPGRSSTGPTSSRGWRTPPTRSTCCSRAATPAR